LILTIKLLLFTQTLLLIVVIKIFYLHLSYDIS